MASNSPRSFVARRDGIVNSLLTKVKIGLAFDHEVGDIQPSPIEYIAIWDTGATNSVITTKVAIQCGLKPIGMARMDTAGGTRDCPVYFISIALPNNAGISQVRVTECDKLTGNADVLIGMDIMNLGDFAVTNYGGKTVFSFRMPSMGVIDFVAQQVLSARLIKTPLGDKTVNAKPSGNRAERRQSKKNR